MFSDVAIMRNDDWQDLRPFHIEPPLEYRYFIDTMNVAIANASNHILFGQR